MAQIKPPHKNALGRYLVAIIFVILFIEVIRILDRFIIFIVSLDFPQYIGDLAYLSAAFNALLGIIGTYFVYRVLTSIVNFKERRQEGGSEEVTKSVLRILFYAAVITVLLVSFGPVLGISLSQSLAGGAVGGIIIGLAVLTIVSGILSGFLVSTSKTLVAGDVLVLHSTTWGDLLCKVINVNVLFAEVLTQNGNRIRLPNTLLFSATTFTKLKVDSSYNYSLSVTIPPDVPIEKFDKRVEQLLKEKFVKRYKGFRGSIFSQRRLAQISTQS